MCNNQFKAAEDIITIFGKHKLTKIEAIGVMEVLKYNLLKGDIQ